jgi:hypothetical protein
MSFKSILATIEKDINIGLEFAAPIIGAFEPGLGPILSAIGGIVGSIEAALGAATATTAAPATLPAIDLSPVVQQVAYSSAIVQHKAATS